MKILKRLIFLFLTVTLIPVNTFPLKITDANLTEFDSLLKYLSNHNVVELNLSNTNINDEQLTAILHQIGRNLKTLELWNCYNLHNFKAIRNCTLLQELSISRTNIDDEQLTIILNEIGGNLKALELWNCYNLHNFKAIRYCVHLQELDLSWTYINNEQLVDILNQMGRNLRMLWLLGYYNLHNFEVIKNCCVHFDVRLIAIPNEIGGNLKMLELCPVGCHKNKMAISSFKKAIELIVYVTQLLEAVKSGSIDHKIFKKEIKILNTCITIKQDWSKCSSNYFLNTTRDVQTAICNYAIILCKESYPEDLWINRNEISKNPDLYAAQMILKLIRNAMGHISARSDNEAYPIWSIHNKNDRKLFEVKSIGVVLDATNLDGKKFDYSYLGGLENLFILLKYLMKDLEKKLI